MGIGRLPDQLSALTVLKHIKETIIILDDSQNIIWMNDIACNTLDSMLQLYGLNSVEEAVGKSIDHFRSIKDHNPHAIDFQSGFRSRVTIQDRYTAEAIISPVPVPDNKVLYIIILVDVTSHAQEEEERSELLASLTTPHLKIWDGILAIPITGLLTDERAEKLKEVVLYIALKEKADYLLFNVSALSKTDDRTSFYLTQISDALRLMGVNVYFVGVSPQLAMNASASIAEWRTFQTAKDALLYIMDLHGVKITGNA
ncbi:hypothetical protein BTO28_16160 [Domibacillus epiphyticus]|uniref:STAS domain-containing protein n=2 Tax=Domibacillus epiphyticus TaxID=1714355 RepID=A0A1V2A418_9BACI|nr:hypothetical protein BTO28_16160 [Domibacillus epiphyticus]